MKMKRSELYPMPEYFDRYILLADDIEMLEALQISLYELENIPLDLWQSLGNQVYAPGKWTIKDLMQHMIDTERIFSYRAVSFARGDEQVPLYDEDEFAKNAHANERTLDALIAEAIALRKSTIHLFQSFTDDMLAKLGNGFKGEYSVHAIGFILAGHQRWHFKVIEEKYLPLLKV